MCYQIFVCFLTDADHPYDEILLTNEDFEVALNQYTPSSLRDVPLHSAGELGWEDVGGLKDVKQSLIETLQLPAKVSCFYILDCSTINAVKLLILRQHLFLSFSWSQKQARKINNTPIYSSCVNAYEEKLNKFANLKTNNTYQNLKSTKTLLAQELLIFQFVII